MEFENLWTTQSPTIWKTSIMKKFKFLIHGNIYEVEIKNLEDNVVELDVNGTAYEVEIEKKLAQPVTPKLVRQQVSPSTNQHKSEQKTAKPGEKKGTGIVKAPLPGTILNIFVKTGDTVKVGDKLILLEAMKMENNINADKGGIIQAIKVQTGDSVLEGDVLVEIGL